MSKQKSRPTRTVTVAPTPDTKPKRRLGCMRYMWGVLLGCGLAFYAIMSIPTPSTGEHNATRTAQAAHEIKQASESTVNRPAPSTSVPTIVQTEIAQAGVQSATINVTGTANAMLEITNAAASTERAQRNSIVLTQLAAVSPSPTITDTVQPTPVPPTQAPSEFWYTTARANARSCPRTSCNVVTVLNAGTRVEVTGSEQGETVNGSATWRMVLAGGQIAYVHVSLLSQNQPRPTSAPVQQQSQPISTAQPLQPPPVVPQFSCNCSKTCEQMMSCDEAYFQLNTCGCGRRDGDSDGVPCESICPGG